jgi:hypothetical protein
MFIVPITLIRDFGFQNFFTTKTRDTKMFL